MAILLLLQNATLHHVQKEKLDLDIPEHHPVFWVLFESMSGVVQISVLWRD